MGYTIMIENFDIESYKRVGEIRFGSSRLEVRNLFPDYTDFKKNEAEENTIDAYENFHVYYDEENLCEAIDFFGNAKLTFNNKELLGNNYRDVKSEFLGIDTNLDFDECGFTSYKYGIGVYVSNADDDDAIVEGVIVFRNGYYD